MKKIKVALLITLFFSIGVTTFICASSMRLDEAKSKIKLTYALKSNYKLVGNFIVGAKTAENTVVLTFDDGPVRNTNKLIELLKELECPATFFLICNNLEEKDLSIYKDKLFELGIHGYFHDDYTKYNFLKMCNEVEKSKAALWEKGIITPYFRPPYGKLNYLLSNALKLNRLTGVLWSIDSADWELNKKENNNENGKKIEKENSIVSYILDNLAKGSIILFHDNTPISVIRQVIVGIRERDYKIIALRDLLASNKKIFCLEAREEIIIPFSKD